MKALLAALILLASSPLLSGCITSAALAGRFICEESESPPKPSPNGDYAIVLTGASCGMAGNQGSARVWLESTDSPGKRQRIFKTERLTEVIWLDARTVEITYANRCNRVREPERVGDIRFVFKGSDNPFRQCTEEKQS